MITIPANILELTATDEKELAQFDHEQLRKFHARIRMTAKKMMERDGLDHQNFRDTAYPEVIEYFKRAEEYVPKPPPAKTQMDMERYKRLKRSFDQQQASELESMQKHFQGFKNVVLQVALELGIVKYDNVAEKK